MKKKLVSILLILSVGSVCMACGLEQSTDNGPKSLLGGSKDVEEVAGDEENEDDVKIEVVEGYSYSDEYKAAFEADDRAGANYKKSGDAEISEFESWQEAYKTLIEDCENDEMEHKYSLIYVDEDDVPELVYTTMNNQLAIATFTNPTVNIFSSQIEDIKYIKGKNSLIAHENIVAASTLNDYVVAIKDGFFIQLAYGSSRPLDVWAEDSFDENGDPIISYWEVNGQELSSQEEYDEIINKYIDTKLVVDGFENGGESADDIIAKIDSME